MSVYLTRKRLIAQSRCFEEMSAYKYQLHSIIIITRLEDRPTYEVVEALQQLSSLSPDLSVLQLEVRAVYHPSRQLMVEMWRNLSIYRDLNRSDFRTSTRDEL